MYFGLSPFPAKMLLAMNPTSGEPSAGGSEGVPALSAETMMATAATAAPRRPTCRFVVTGFGPFRGVPDNPTKSLVRRLCECRDEVGLPDVHECRVMETSAGHVRDEVEGIYSRLRRSSSAGGVDRQDDGGLAGSTNVVVVLHLGVDCNGTRFKLERCAYNDATFRAPDERGYLPCRECISLLGGGGADNDESHALPPREWGECIETTLDLDDLCCRLRERDGDDEAAVIVSADPGRFVCNYTYYLSLNSCRSVNDKLRRDDDVENNGVGGGGDNTMRRRHHALFVHVPPFDVVSEGRQLDFIVRVMKAIERQIIEGSGE